MAITVGSSFNTAKLLELGEAGEFTVPWGGPVTSDPFFALSPSSRLFGIFALTLLSFAAFDHYAIQGNAPTLSR